jgi:hypothetical protein
LKNDARRDAPHLSIAVTQLLTYNDFSMAHGAARRQTGQPRRRQHMENGHTPVHVPAGSLKNDPQARPAGGAATPR